jgi:hypothetical protein
LTLVVSLYTGTYPELMLLDGMNVRLFALFGQCRETCHHFLSLLNGLFTAKPRWFRRDTFSQNHAMRDDGKLIEMEMMRYGVFCKSIPDPSFRLQNAECRCIQKRNGNIFRRRILGSHAARPPTSYKPSAISCGFSPTSA